MPRRREVPKREIYPDPIYQSTMVTKFINSLMKEGKKSLAEGTFYRAMKIMEEKLKQDPVKVFQKAMDNIKPSLEVKSRRVGGATYQVPIEVSPRRRNSLSIRWLLTFSRQRGEKTMEERLAAELIDAFNNRGATIKKKEDTHKMAEANKAFAHYRW
jgi:small subunit ribosomal protein S7